MIHSCNSIKNPGQQCLACMYGVDDSLVNDGASSTKMMLALATLAVGGGVAMYLYNKKDKAASGSSSVQSQAQQLNAVLPPEAAEGLISSIGNVLNLAIVTGGLPPVSIDGTNVYRYVTSDSDFYKTKIQASQEKDAIGDLNALSQGSGQINILVPSFVPRLGLATDIQDQPSIKAWNRSLSAYIDVASASTTAENRSKLAKALGIPAVAGETAEGLRKRIIDTFNGYPDALTIFAAKVALVVCARTAAYLLKRQKTLGASLTKGAYVKNLNPLDMQRIAAGVFWAAAQNPPRNTDSIPLQSFDRGLALIAQGLNMNADLWYTPIPSNHDLYKTYLQMVDLFRAFLDGVFNCENPGTNLVAVPVIGVDAVQAPKAINFRIDQRNTAADPVINPVFLAGAVFFKGTINDQIQVQSV